MSKEELRATVEAAERPPAPKKQRRRRRADVAGIEAAVELMNQEFAMVLAGRAMVIRERTGAKGYLEHSFLPPGDLRAWKANERYLTAAGKTEGIGALWLEHPLRRSYDDLVFQPEGAPPSSYNLWRGPNVQPSDTDPWKACPTFMDHVRTNLAREDEANCMWIWGWTAHLFQRPAERIGTALVLRGKQGTGKTKFGEVIGSLIPAHYLLVDSQRYIIGQFNSHMATCCLLQADEGFWAGDRQAAGVLKSLITSEHHMIERKGVDPVPVRNLVRLLVTSNESWVVPAGLEERRFAIFDVGQAAMQNTNYFAEIDREMAAGGREALLGWLLKFDLASVDVRKIPATGALLEQKIESLHPHELWWRSCLLQGAVLPSQDEWPVEPVPISSVYNAYLGYCEKLAVRSRRMSEEQLGTALRKLLPSKDGQDPLDRSRPRVNVTDDRGVTERKKRWCYTFPPLEDCRRAFDECLGQPTDWGDEDPPDGG
jgi:hypothetical protein